MKNEKHIVLKDVKKAFGSKIVLRGTNLSVNRGESLVVIGGSGTGKSVMLKCILGLVPADSGSIIVDGDEMVGASLRCQDRVISKVSMLFQGSALFDSLTIAQNVSFRLRQQKELSDKIITDKVMEKLAAVGLEERTADLYPAELSGGMLRRAALARAIITKPEIIFFDEPTTGLDPIMSAVINDLIKKCVTELGATAVTITHDLASAKHIANRVALIHEGKILWHDDISKLYKSNHPAVEQFVNGRLEGPLTPKV